MNAVHSPQTLHAALRANIPPVFQFQLVTAAVNAPENLQALSMANKTREIESLRAQLAYQARRVEALQKTLNKHYPPACPYGRIEVGYPHQELGTLTCHFECGDEDDGAVLMEAYIGPVNIFDRLTEKEVSVIEAEFDRLYAAAQR